MIFCDCLKKSFLEKRGFKRYFNDKRFKKALKDYCDFEYYTEIETDSDIGQFLESFEDHIKRHRKSLIWLQQEYSVLESLLERSVARTEKISSKAQNLLAVLITVISILVPIGGFYLADVSRIRISILLLLIGLVILSIYTLYKSFSLIFPSEKYEFQNIFNELNEQASEIEFYQLKIAHTKVSLNLRDCQNEDDGIVFQNICFIASLTPVALIAIWAVHFYPVVKTFLIGCLCQYSFCHCY